MLVDSRGDPKMRFIGMLKVVRTLVWWILKPARSRARKLYWDEVLVAVGSCRFGDCDSNLLVDRFEHELFVTRDR
jgi:hypothetical protein